MRIIDKQNKQHLLDNFLQTKCHTKSKRVRAFKRAEQKIELIKNALNEKLSMRSGKKGSEISWQVGNK